MPLTVTKLKECPQALWLGDRGYSSEGICYYMSEYVRITIWGAARTFRAAKTAAEEAIPATIVKAGKAKNLRDRGGDAVPQEVYTSTGPLAGRSLYRVGLWFGDISEAPDDAHHQNHEAVAVTANQHEVVFFEPNFGFYHARNTGQTLQAIFQAGVRSLYTPTDDHAENFHYKLARYLG